MMTAYIPFEINEIKEIMEAFNLQGQYDIEYIIRLHIIEYCNKNNLYSDILKEYCNDIKKIPSLIGRFASTITADNIVSEFNKLQKQYREPFLDYVNQYKVYERIPWRIMERVCIHSACMFKIFEYQAMVLHYDNELLSLIETENELIEMIIRDEFEESRQTKQKLYFPSALSPQKKDQLAQKYINSGKANTNCLRLIFNSRGTECFMLTDQTRLLAKQKHTEAWKFAEGKPHSFTYGCEVMFKSIPDYRIVVKDKSGILCAEYSKEWITEKLDFPTLLNNFIYLFEYCDLQGRMDFVSLNKDASVFEAVLQVWAKTDYFDSIGFSFKRMLHTMQMQAYHIELKKNNIDMQDIFKWFFEEYLKKEFNVEGFVYVTPSKDTTFLEKCILLSCAIDSVLKQFNMFCLNGCIERELFEISSNHVVFQNVKWLLDKKYAYFGSESVKKEASLLFSDQSHLSYVAKKTTSFPTLYSWIEHQNLQLSDFLEYQISDIQWLMRRGSIYCDENGILKLNQKRAIILKNLFNHDVISCAYIGDYRNAFDELVANGDIVIESTLFSRKEQEYLDFMLNNSKFGNGPALRNNYVHGTHSLNPEKHERDYYELLEIMVMIILKINNELCIKYPQSN